MKHCDECEDLEGCHQFGCWRIPHPESIKAKLRRSARYLQGNDTSYFNRPAQLEAIRILYRMADEAIHD